MGRHGKTAAQLAATRRSKMVPLTEDMVNAGIIAAGAEDNRAAILLALDVFEAMCGAATEGDMLALASWARGEPR